ncbi:MAG TPA: hypothetical protein VLX92_25625 [Kofleriaceae bacterium]|nr:hypothetical protein [Kofleriaceae bacterium]
MFLVRLLLLVAAFAAACHPGGEYQGGTSMLSGLDRGETNGRMFDFVSNRSEGDDWNIRLRGTSMYVSYGDGDKVNDLGTQNITDKESDKVWDLIDKVDIPSRGKGKKDEDAGYVELRLREPGEDKHDIYTCYIPRDNDNIDDDVAGLIEYLQKLVKRHFKTDPNF